MLNSHFHPQHISPDNTFYLLYKKSCYLQLKIIMKQSGEICSIFLLPLMTSAMKTVGWTHVHTVEIAIMKEPISLVPSVNPAIIPSSASQTALLNKKAGCLLADTELVSVLTLADIFIMRIFSSYEEDFTPGDRVQAGEILGFMGNTGYGQEALPKGSGAPSPWHLYHHPEGQDISVNPYHVLQCLRKKIRKYTYY